MSKRSAAHMAGGGVPQQQGGAGGGGMPQPVASGPPVMPPELADVLRAAKRSRPTDRSLPATLRKSVPESAFYYDLQLLERKLDWTIARKRAEIADSITKPARIKRTLRIFISNTCANQPFQTKSQSGAEGADGAAGGGADGSAANTVVDAPSWTLRIQGRLLEPAHRSRANAALTAQAAASRIGAYRFSNLISSMTVEIQRDQSLHPDSSNVIEWHRPIPQSAPHASTTLTIGQPTGSGGTAGPAGAGAGSEPPLLATTDPSLDGFEIRRLGSQPVKVRIVLYLAHTPEQYTLAPELAELLDMRQATRADVIQALWAYIRDRRLLDDKDRRKIRCDAKLLALFKVETIAFHHVPEVVNRFLSPVHPVVLEYYIRTDKAEHKSPVAYDVEVEMEDQNVRVRQHEVLRKFDHGTDLSKQILDLDDEIAQAALSLQTHSATAAFLSSFAKDPHRHLRTWLASQARDLDAIIGATALGGASGAGVGIGKEELRRSENFKGAWVNEAVIIHEGQRLADRMQELQRAEARAAAAAAAAQGAHAQQGGMVPGAQR
ncbi:SWI/SNF and RSC complex subunit Ssr3 [Tilletia horrida]|nr:SWI/SNF and RSC complex subunit Ssr3 [Tilletia horrida]